MKNIFSTKYSKTVLLLLPMILVFGFWVSTKADGGIILGCVAKDGLLSIIGQGSNVKNCAKNQTPLSWNIQGVKGDKGDKGDQGIQGEKGDKGDQGEHGEAGPGIIGGGLLFGDPVPHSEYGSLFVSFRGYSHESDAAQVLPVGGTLSKFTVRINEDALYSYAFTVMKNGEPTSETCSFSNPATNCSDTIDSVTFDANDSISIRATGSGNAGSMRWTAEYR